MPPVKFSPWLALAVVALAGMGVMCWETCRRDPETAPWNAADIPPDNVPVIYGTSCMGYAKPAGRLDYTPARHRRYPTSLVSASASIIGTF